MHRPERQSRFSIEYAKHGSTFRAAAAWLTCRGRRRCRIFRSWGRSEGCVAPNQRPGAGMKICISRQTARASAGLLCQRPRSGERGRVSGRPRAPRPRITCAIDFPHASRADGRGNFINADAGTGGEGQNRRPVIAPNRQSCVAVRTVSPPIWIVPIMATAATAASGRMRTDRAPADEPHGPAQW